MEPGLDLDLASRETPVSSTGQALLAVIAEQQGVITGQQGAIAELRQRVESLEARLSGGGLGARMPGHKPAARRKKPAEQEKKPRKEASPRLRPAADGTRRAGGPRPGVLPRMPYHPERGLGAADPGSHRHSGSPGGSHGARIHSPDVSAVPETAAAPGPSERSGCRPSAPGGQPRIQYGAGSVKPDSDPAGRGPAARKDHPMVSANVPSSDCYLLPFPVAEGCCWADPVPASCRASTWSCPLGGGGVRGGQGSSCRSWMARAGCSLRFRPLLSSGVRMVSRPLRLRPGPAGVAPATRPGSGRCGRGWR